MNAQSFFDQNLIPRIRAEKRYTVETLINEEVLLLAEYLRDEKETWLPRIPLPSARWIKLNGKSKDFVLIHLLPCFWDLAVRDSSSNEIPTATSNCLYWLVLFALFQDHDERIEAYS